MTKNTERSLFPHLEPWPDPVAGLALADELRATLNRFVILPNAADVALTLWILHAHAHDAASISPILAITAPMKRSGKTTLGDLLSQLVPRPLLVANASTAVVFRLVDQHCPTLMIDEAETFLDQNRELIGVLNSGQRRAGARVLRTSGENFDPRSFSTWAPKVLIGNGRLPPTLDDRSIVIAMRRKLPSESVERLLAHQLDQFVPLAQRCARWTQDMLEQLRVGDPEVPSTLNDRAADNWRPLMAIADAIGGDWPRLAQSSALLLSGADQQESERAERLLKDVRRAFTDSQSSRLRTTDILKALNSDEDGPWGALNDGQGLNSFTLAKLLRDFGVQPRDLWFREAKGKTFKGYERDQFTEAFQRYLSADEGQDPQGPQVTSAGAA